MVHSNNEVIRFSNEYEGLWNEFEFVAFLLKISQGSWKSIIELLDTLQRVMEGDDRTVSCEQHDVAQNIVGIEVPGIVSRYEVPHHDSVLASESPICMKGHPAAWRTEEMAMDECVCLLDVLTIATDRMGQRTPMVERMVAHLVTLVYYSFVEFRVFTDVVADNKEGGLYVELLERIKYKRC